MLARGRVSGAASIDPNPKESNLNMALSNAQKAAKAAAAAAAAAKKNEPAAQAAGAPEAPAVRETKGAGGVKATSRTVVVVCKMPRGLYLDIHQPVQQDQRVSGGGIEKRTIHMRMPERVRLKPAVLPFGAIPNYPIVEGFSLTRDVDADFWRKYSEQNKGLQMIVEGLLRGFDNEADATAYCREFAKLQHGLEPLDVTGKTPDPRIEQANSPNLSDIETDTDSKTRAA